MKRLIVMMMFLAIAGCASVRSGSSRSQIEKNMILPNNAERIELETKQKFLMPAPIENPLPIFPSNYPSGNSDITVCAEFVVSAEGAVSRVRQIVDAEGCEPVESVSSRVLFPQVQSTVATWSFFGAAICAFEVDEKECDAPNAKVAPTAVKLAYKFRFLVEDGRKSTATTRQVRPKR